MKSHIRESLCIEPEWCSTNSFTYSRRHSTNFLSAKIRCGAKTARNTCFKTWARSWRTMLAIKIYRSTCISIKHAEHSFIIFLSIHVLTRYKAFCLHIGNTFSSMNVYFPCLCRKSWQTTNQPTTYQQPSDGHDESTEKLHFHENGIAKWIIKVDKTFCLKYIFRIDSVKIHLKSLA